jgi:hypothetical protein
MKEWNNMPKVNPRTTTKRGKGALPGSAEESDDILWGVREVAQYIRRTEPSTNYLINAGIFDGAVTKLSHKVIVGSKRKIDAILAGEPVRLRSAKAEAAEAEV